MDMEYFKPTSERFAEALERALRRWRKRREAQAPLRLPPAPTPPPVTIALSCEAGANGPAVAREVGGRLGWPVYDHELVEWVAREMGVRAELLESVDQRRMSWLLEAIEGFTSGPVVSEAAFAHHLAQTLLALAAHGECVIVGRGAAQLLPAETTLRVRLVGPLKDRVAAIGRRFGCPPEEAARWVAETDRERNAFIRDHFSKDPTDPGQYDLLLNAFRFTAAQCGELTVTALYVFQGRPLTRTSPP
jgi:hypothetical protein